jgi:7,8-dihydropterin-6-yl-methyl-4-(beta-D-ribofuranosyl)aminobenzene 5'-phosphate synthase
MQTGIGGSAQSRGDAADPEAPARVTTLYDAFGPPSPLRRGWGYSALVEYGGRRVLFDTGSDNADFAFNVAHVGVDLTRLDFVVLSHRHGDHTSGLHHVLSVNPGVTIYTPVEPAGFDTPVPPALHRLIHRKVEGLPSEFWYFGGEVPERIAAGTPWPGARFAQISTPTEVVPGFLLFSTRSEVPGTREMNEVSLAIRTPRGLALVVGCSHSGIEKILGAAAELDSGIHMVLGGFHLTDIPDPEVVRLATAFRDRWKIERMAPGHCTGQLGFLELLRAYGADFDRAGLGEVIKLSL